MEIPGHRSRRKLTTGATLRGGFAVLLAALISLGSGTPAAPDHGLRGEAGGPATALPMHTAQATNPSSATMDFGQTDRVEFVAPLAAGAKSDPLTFTPASCGTTPNDCSQLVLHVADPGGKDVRVQIEWSIATNDYDLFAMRVNPDGSETQVDESGNQAPATSEQVQFTPEANSTYHIVITHYAAATPEDVEGTALFVEPATVVEPGRTGPAGTGIVFSPNGQTTVTDGNGDVLGVAPTGRGTTMAAEAGADVEPSIRADQLGNVYPAGIRGVPAGVDVWRFGPGAYCPRFTFHDDDEFPTGGSPADPDDGYVWLGQPDGIFPDEGAGAPDAGGGDIALALSSPEAASIESPPSLSMVSLTLANITAAASFDRGNEWTPANAFSAVAPPADRQWIEAYGESTVYLFYRTLSTLTGLVLQKSIDSGQTYTAHTAIASPMGYTPGWIDVDRTPNLDGSVDIYISGVASHELVVFHCVDPTPEMVNVTPITCSQHTVDDKMSHGHLFDPVSVGSDGTVYAVWSNDEEIFYSYSTDKAANWSNPVRVTDASDADTPNYNVFPWITAGDDGRIGIVWYGTFSASNANDAEWKAYYAYTDNAKAATPELLWTEASDHVLHKGNISQGGFNPLGADENRNLADFFEVAHDPRDGAAVIAFADDHNDLDAHTYYTRQIAGPGLVAGQKPTQPDCPPLTPLRDPEVLDFRGDGNGNSGTLGANQPDVDILNMDYDWEEEDGDLFLTAEVVLNELLTQPVDRRYRAFFATNSARGLMDAGDEFFMELTTESGSPAYWLGVKGRRADGSTEQQRVEAIDDDQVATAIEPGAPGRITLRVRADRLDWSFAPGGTQATDPPGVATDGGTTPPQDGDLVLGLMGQSNEATSGTLVDETRGGSYLVLGGVPDGGGDGGGAVIECDDDGVTRSGPWQSRTTNDGPGQGRRGGSEEYCRNVGHRGGGNADERPYVEFRFPGSSSEVRYDYFTNPRGGVVEVTIDGDSRGTIDQHRSGSDESGHEDLASESASYEVTPRSEPHTLRVTHRTDLDGASRNIAFVDGFAVDAGASGTSGSAAVRTSEIAFTGEAAGGETVEHVIVADAATLMLGAVIEPVDADLFGSGALRVAIFDPAGLQLGSSDQAIAPELVRALTVVPGQYTVKVSNTTDRPVRYRASTTRTIAP